MSDSTELALRFEDNATQHDDVVLELGGEQYRCDSYYFSLDTQILPGREDTRKVRLVMRRLLEQWLMAARKIEAGDTAYLPFDFSDQYTAWIACERREDSFALVKGYSRREGWALAPSDIGGDMFELLDFHPEAEECLVPHTTFEQLVKQSIAAL